MKSFYQTYGGVVQWVARLTRNGIVVISKPTKGSRCLLEQENLPWLLSNGLLMEWICA